MSVSSFHGLPGAPGNDDDYNQRLQLAYLTLEFMRALKAAPADARQQFVTILCSEFREPCAVPRSHDDRVFALSTLSPADLALLDAALRFLLALKDVAEPERRAVLATIYDEVIGAGPVN